MLTMAIPDLSLDLKVTRVSHRGWPYFSVIFLAVRSLVLRRSVLVDDSLEQIRALRRLLH
jgi:hypothetical protein